MFTLEGPIHRLLDHTPINLPPRIKVSYPKAMTIALGFLCRDGIVVGADTQLTMTGSHKTYACKLFSHRHPAWSAVVAYAGYPDFVNAFNDRLPAEIEHAEKKWGLTLAV